MLVFGRAAGGGPPVWRGEQPLLQLSEARYRQLALKWLAALQRKQLVAVGTDLTEDAHLPWTRGARMQSALLGSAQQPISGRRGLSMAACRLFASLAH